MGIGAMEFEKINELEISLSEKWEDKLSFVSLLLGPVDSLQDLVTTGYRWLHKFFAAA